MTLPAATFLDGLAGDDGIVAGPAVLVGVLLVGVLLVGLVAGFSRGRVGLLLVGLVAVVVIGLLVVGVPDPAGPRDVAGARLAELYGLVLPPAVAFATGWSIARGTWFRRAVVVGVAVVVPAAFPYAAAGAATAGASVPGS